MKDKTFACAEVFKGYPNILNKCVLLQSNICADV
jgi:hypothetical protein